MGTDDLEAPGDTSGAQRVALPARHVPLLAAERRTMLQELGLAGAQIWQSLSEAAGRGYGDTGMAVLFTDLVDFSSWALRAGDAPALELLTEVERCVSEAITRHGGRIMRRLGDGVMATFASAQEAVEAALDAAAAVDAIEVDGYRPRLRCGAHWGSPRRLAGDWVGVDVEIAARVGDAARAGQVLVSDALLARIDLECLSAERAGCQGAAGGADAAPAAVPGPELPVTQISRR